MTEKTRQDERRDSIEIVTQRMSSIVQRNTILQGFLNKRGTQWNRRIVRFQSNSERKRIGILIQPDPGVFPQDYDFVQFSFVQARIVSMISEKEFVPAVSFIPLSTLEKKMTKNLLNTFKNGFTNDESTISQLVGESVLGMSTTINSVKNQSLVLQALTNPVSLLVIGSSNKETLIVSKNDLGSTIAGMIVLEGFLKRPLSLVVETECTPEFFVKATKEIDVSAELEEKVTEDQADTYEMMTMTIWLFPEWRTELEKINSSLYPMYRIKNDHFQYLFKNIGTQSIEFKTQFSIPTYDGDIFTDSLQSVFPNDVLPSSSIYSVSESWYEKSGYPSMESQVYTLRINNTRQNFLQKNTPYDILLSGYNETLYFSNMTRQESNFAKRTTSLPVPWEGWWTAPFFGSQVFQFTESERTDMHYITKYPGTLELIANIEHRILPISIGEETVVCVSHTFLVGENPLYVIPSLLLEQEWKKYCSSGSRWKFTGLAIRNKTITTEYRNDFIENDYSIFYGLTTKKEVSSNGSSACPSSSNLPTGAFTLEWNENDEEREKIYQNSFFGKNGFDFNSISIHSAQDFEGKTEPTKTQVELSGLGGSLFRITPLSSSNSTNEFSFLMDTSTQNGEFTIINNEINCSYANVILKLGSAGQVRWDLEVLATIQRMI